MSVEAKSFIRGLLSPDPGMRPGAGDALGDPVRLVSFLVVPFPPALPSSRSADCFCVW